MAFGHKTTERGFDGGRVHIILSDFHLLNRSFQRLFSYAQLRNVHGHFRRLFLRVHSAPVLQRKNVLVLLFLQIKLGGGLLVSGVFQLGFIGVLFQLCHGFAFGNLLALQCLGSN